MDHQTEKEREPHTPQSISFSQLQFALMLLTFLFSAKHCKNWWSEWERESQPSWIVALHCTYTLYQILMLFIFCYLWSEWETCYSFSVFLFLSQPFPSFSSTQSNHFVCKVVPLSSSIPSFLFLFPLSPIFLHLSLPPAQPFPLSHINIMCFSIPLTTVAILGNTNQHHFYVSSFVETIRLWICCHSTLLHAL